MQFHDRGDRGIERAAPADVVRDLGERLVGLPAHLALRRSLSDAASTLAGDGRRADVIVHRLPQALA